MVLHNSSFSQPFQPNIGVERGYPLSPLLSTTMLDEIMRKVSSKRRGIRWSLSRQFEDLGYAGICLFSHKFSNMQSKLKQLERLVLSVGLGINTKKIMGIDNTGTYNIMLRSRVRRLLLLSRQYYDNKVSVA